jgi:hypothetical protein
VVFIFGILKPEDTALYGLHVYLCDSESFDKYMKKERLLFFKAFCVNTHQVVALLLS